MNKYQQKMLDERGLQDTRLMMKMEELEKKINAKDVDGAMSRLETLESLVVSFKYHGLALLPMARFAHAASTSHLHGKRQK